MDTSKPAIFVNGALLPMHVRKRLVVKGSPPSAPLSNFVEVIGIADSEKSIQAEIWTNFGEVFDTHSYNQLCQLANGEYQHLFL
ncbi:REPLICATION PROTEIN A 14 KDA SUBUNIT A-RELATED [Salix purpurea]|uniref:REPLICATION PROTEIN A 14 kDa SUBUNIT A-RELATED n=1 Tax=Salix purpurea TaxID=77065 RepID=A0A9Q0T2M4_SALPP|nr:REPLICATION PROTEIN A 14 KDA SUBUNIT A-RELATED [Salix purpurea]